MAETGEPTTCYHVAVQRGNCASVLGGGGHHLVTPFLLVCVCVFNHHSPYSNILSSKLGSKDTIIHRG